MTLPVSAETTRVAGRRRCTEEEKRRIVAECAVPGASVSVVARRHDVNANLVFTWRHRLQLREAALEPAPFVPAVIAPDAVARPDPATAKAARGRRESEDGTALRH